MKRVYGLGLALIIFGMLALTTGCGEQNLSGPEQSAATLQTTAPVPECQVDADCAFTEFHIEMKNISDCFCPMCPEAPVTKTTQIDRSKAWHDICWQWANDKPCAMPGCMLDTKPACQKGQCIAQKIQPDPVPVAHEEPSPEETSGF